MCIRDSHNPARGGRGPSTPKGPDGPLRGSESAKVGDPPPSLQDTGGAALRAAPPATGSEKWGFRTFAASELPRGPLSPL
eukprot:13883907-Alexandrium_andersonii.AAC.1